MERSLAIAATLALVGGSLAACGHTNRFAGTPWNWSSEWHDPNPGRAPTRTVATPVHVIEQRTAVAATTSRPDQPAPTLVPLDPKAAKRRPDGKRSKRRKH